MNSILKKAGILVSVIIVTFLGSSSAHAAPKPPPPEAVKAIIVQELSTASKTLQQAMRWANAGERMKAADYLRQTVVHVQNAGGALHVLVQVLGPQDRLVQEINLTITRIMKGVQALAPSL